MIDIIAMEEKFTGEYKYAFSKISTYGTMSQLDYEAFEDRILNIYDLFMNAQTEGKPVSKIVGNDIEAFCEEYYRSHDKGERLKDIFKRIY